MSAIFSDMENVICFIDNIAFITNWILWKSFEPIGWDTTKIERKQLTSQWQQVLLLCNWSCIPWICTYPTRSQTSSQKVRAIVKIAKLKAVKQVHSFIGMIDYYKDHIPCHSDLLTPLTTLTKKGARFKWTDDCQHSFDGLKCLLAEQTVLAYPNFTIPK
jgi:hypothetical protein